MRRYGLAHKNRQDRSKRASTAANARWSRYHADQEPRPPDKPMPDPLRRVTVEDFLSGVSHVLTWHWIGKARSFEIRVDGKFWKVGAWTASLEKTRKSCVRIGRRHD